jgi:hypothetical protein
MEGLEVVRRAAVVAPLAIVMACLVSEAGFASAGTVTPICDTPSQRDFQCSRWYTEPPVALSWSWDANGIPVSGCNLEVFSADTPGAKRSCTVQWSNPTTSTTVEVQIKVDHTPPQVLPPQPSRPADYNGWFNHPLDLGFQGSDATSGVASCSSTTYSGPDGAGVTVTGTCRDVAGNVGSGSFPLNFDSTPPAPPLVIATPGDRRIVLGWFTSPDTEGIEVVRYAPTAPPASVFSGPGNGHTDLGLTNGKSYRYVVVATDQAGNRSQSEVSAVPTASAPPNPRNVLTPPNGARVSGPPMLRWKPVRHASYYNLQLHRHGKLLSRWPRKAHFQLKRKWRFGGKLRVLAPGRYRWYVWPGFGVRSAHRYGKRIVASKFTVVR